MVHVQGAGPIDTAMLGGPSTRSVAADDPIWQPINGISLQDYADLARDAQARGINDEAGMITLVPGARLEPGRHQGGARRLGAADGPVDGRRTAVPQVHGLLTGNPHMPNPFKDWARMYGANKQYLESQGRPSSFLGQIGDIPNRIHEAADASEIGMKMMRHAQLTNGAGLPATVTVEGIWQVGSYMNMSPVLRIQGRVARQDGTAPYSAVFDEVVAQMHVARVQPGAKIAVFVDPQNPVDMAIDWIRTGQLGPSPPGATAGPGEPGARPV